MSGKGRVGWVLPASALVSAADQVLFPARGKSQGACLCMCPQCRKRSFDCGYP